MEAINVLLRVAQLRAQGKGPSMRKPLRFLLALLLSLASHSALRAQTIERPRTQTPSPAQPQATDATASAAPSSSQAPEEVMKRLADLVHSGKYPEAQQLAAGLLMAYPDDQRLIKIKALLDKSQPSFATANA